MCLLCVSMMGMSAWAEADETITFSEKGYSNGQTVETESGTNFTVTFDKGTNSNAPKYYTSGTAIRAYGGNKITVSSTTKTIAKVEFTFGSSDGSNEITADVGTWSSPTWTGEESSITFTIGGTSGNRRLASIAVTYLVGTEKSATTTSIDYSGLTNFDIKNGINAGKLAAIVTDDDDNIVSGTTFVWTSSNEDIVSVDEYGNVTLVREGSATITANYAGDDTYKASKGSYEITIVDGRFTTIWSEDFAGYEDNKAPVSGTNATYAVENGGGTTQTYATDAYAGGESPELLIAKSNGSFTASITSLNSCLKNMKLSYKSNNTINVEVLVNGLSIKTSSDQNIEFVLPENPKSLVISFTNSLTSKNVRLDDIVLKGIVDEVTYERNVTADNYGTICLPSAASVVGATVYSVAGITKSNDKITGVALEEVTGDLVAGTPYIFKATADKLVATYKDFAVDAPVATTGLVGNLDAATTINAGEYIYILGTDNKMHKLSGTATATVATNRAYLNLEGVDEADASVKGVRLYFDGSEEATAIENLTPTLSQGEGAIYNLAGQQLAAPQRGINIIGGKKVLVK